MAVVVGGSYSPSPSARACTDLKADVASYVGATNAARALAKAEDFIGAAVGKLNTIQWPWMLVYVDLTLVADQIDYDLPTAFGSPRHAATLDTNGKIVGRLGFENMKTFSNENQDTRSSGNPSLYTAYNAHEYGTISLNVAPASSYIASIPTIRLWYFRKVQPCSGSTTALDVPHEVGEWVAWYAKALMAAHFDPPKVGEAKALANDFWNRLIAQKADIESGDWS